MHKVRVGVLRGGPTDYETSLKTGETVVRHLPDEYYTEDIFITKEGVWHKDGLEISPQHALSHLDVVWNALHGNPQIQHLLELHRIPFTGAGAFASSVGKNTVHLKEILKREKIKTPPFRMVEVPVDGPGEELTALFRTYSPPLFIRPISDKAGAHLAKTYSAFVEALEQAFKESDQVMIEEYIPGTPASVVVIDHYRGSERYSLPPVSEVVLTPQIKRELEEVARRVHEVLGLRHYSRVDFSVSPRRGIFVTGLSPQPELGEESMFNKSLTGVGAPVSHFLDHVIQLALTRK